MNNKKLLFYADFNDFNLWFFFYAYGILYAYSTRYT